MSDEGYDDGGFADYDPADDAGPEFDDVDETEDEKESAHEGKDEQDGDRCELSGEDSECEDETGEGAESVGKEVVETEDADTTLSEVVEESSRIKSTLKPKVDPIVKISNSHRRIIIVPDDERQTSNILQKSEAARVDATRAKQMESFPTIFTDASGIHDSVQRARKEREDLRCPLKLRRFVGYGPDGSMFYEEWLVREMVQPALN